MAVFPVVQFPDPVLLNKTESVESFGQRERLLIKDMIDTMHACKGVGLAANQIGVPKRIFVACPDAERGGETVYINPVIISRSGSVNGEEGCLSVTDYYDKVRRSEKVVLRARDISGKEIEVKADGLLARIFQHETDHLDGFLFIHRLGFFAKRRAFKALDPAGANILLKAKIKF